MRKTGPAAGVLLLIFALFTGSCSGHPVLLLTLNPVPGAASNIQVTLIHDGKTGVASFERDNTNHYVSSGANAMPSMGSVSPSTVQLALDLPAKTSGKMDIRVAVTQPSLAGPGPGMPDMGPPPGDMGAPDMGGPPAMMGMPQVVAVACDTVDIQPGLDTETIKLVPPSKDCTGM